MNNKKQQKITVKGVEIVTFKKNESDFISLTDIAKYKGVAETDDVIKNWMRNRSTIEFLGLWEKLNNPKFKPVEFDGLNVALLGMTAKDWRDKNPSPQSMRLVQLNQVAIIQMQSLLDSSSVKKLK